VRFDQRRSGNDEIGITRDFIPRNAAPIGAAEIGLEARPWH